MEHKEKQYIQIRVVEIEDDAATSYLCSELSTKK